MMVDKTVCKTCLLITELMIKLPGDGELLDYEQ